MPIKRVDTGIMGKGNDLVISMCFADAPTTADATTTVELKVPFRNFSLGDTPALPSLQPGTYPDTRFQIAALRYVRDELDAEIERLSNPEGH